MLFPSGVSAPSSVSVQKRLGLFFALSPASEQVSGTHFTVTVLCIRYREWITRAPRAARAASGCCAPCRRRRPCPCLHRICGAPRPPHTYTSPRALSVDQALLDRQGGRGRYGLETRDTKCFTSPSCPCASPSTAQSRPSPCRGAPGRCSSCVHAERTRPTRHAWCAGSARPAHSTR
jgi:hypothetical protein